MKNGTVFNIQKFSVNDGPGIRTTVFLKGCPLRCIWCHNPESKSSDAEIFFDVRKCIGCGKCVQICLQNCHTMTDGVHTFNRDKCEACGKCTEVCYADSLEKAGEIKSVTQVIDEVMKDKAFYDNSGGGITLSGGEPMMQFEFAFEILRTSKEKGLHTCIETCGFAAEDHYRKIAPYVDIFLFDFKESDSIKHKEFTGVGNELILSNLHMLDSIGSKIVLRCPVIPTLNDRNEHFDAIASLANSLANVTEINIEPYHPLGSGKAEMLGRDYVLKDLTFPDDSTVTQWLEYISARTDVTVKKA